MHVFYPKCAKMVQNLLPSMRIIVNYSLAATIRVNARPSMLLKIEQQA